MNTPKKIALIVGAGPAGLTAAIEFLRHTDIQPIIFEASGDIGGLAKTVTYHGNKIDIGGHRFFSKSERVLAWWSSFLPLETNAGKAPIELTYHNKKTTVRTSVNCPDPKTEDKVMLVRKRISRIFFNQQFFDYPLTFNWTTFRRFGLLNMISILGSYVWVRLKPIRPQVTLEDFYINRFGRRLYHIFFKDYTEKVWGVPCHKIPAEWGMQRVKGLSIWSAVKNGLRKIFFRDSTLSQDQTQTSLIEQFLYPKYGPGQLWEEVARQVQLKGGKILLQQEVIGLKREGNKVTQIQVKDVVNQTIQTYTGDYLISSMPVQQFIGALGDAVPGDVQAVAKGLVYRDFITVGVLLKKMLLGTNGLIPDNWVYIQDKNLLVGRIQIFNNWSPYVVKDPFTVWVGLEYFCTEGDSLWSKADSALKELATQELVKLGMIDPADVLDSTVIRVKKTYPCYFGTYDQFLVIREYVNQLENVFLVGRNGMHRYNNQDHSMLTAMTAVENIMNGVTTKDNLWSINVDDDYHEEK